MQTDIANATISSMVEPLLVHAAASGADPMLDPLVQLALEAKQAHESARTRAAKINEEIKKVQHPV